MKAFCLLSRKQAALYQQTVDDLAGQLEDADGIKRKGIVLAILMRLKQICNHPSQWLGDNAWAEEDSGKFARLREIAEEISARQEKALVFTQFKEATAPLAAFLGSVFGRRGLVLHGETEVRKRKDLVRAFQEDDDVPFFVLSLKAGGAGLNLTAASHVIHFDRWWNPAVENQATDRAFRIGQNKNVLVHKFVCRGTVEDRIDEMIEAKQQLAGDFLGGGADMVLTELKDDELLKLVALDVAAAMKEADRMSYFGWRQYVPVAKQAAAGCAHARQARRRRGGPLRPSRSRAARLPRASGASRGAPTSSATATMRTGCRAAGAISATARSWTCRYRRARSPRWSAVPDSTRSEITIASVTSTRWKSICRDCAGTIDSLVELLQGRLAKGVMDRVCREGDGLFPAPKEIKLSCSCPDWADMCKHVAAALYGVGARLDEQPKLLFVLRGVDENELLAGAGQDLGRSKQARASAKVLDDGDMAALFGLEMAESTASDDSMPLWLQDRLNGQGDQGQGICAVPTAVAEKTRPIAPNAQQVRSETGEACQRQEKARAAADR